MVYRTYLQKFASIIKGSELNTGLNPVAELIYGRNTTRLLCYFDHNEIKELIDSGKCPDITKMRHTLNIFNAGSINPKQLHCNMPSTIDGGDKIRTSSFDLIFFLIPQEWDRGKGYDYAVSYMNYDSIDIKEGDGGKVVSTDGANWYQARNGISWNEEGVYTNDTLSNAYDDFASEEGSPIIFARQRFDIGNEDVSVDITEIVRKFVSGELKNHGIGIAFTPQLERLGEAENSLKSNVENYIGFFTDKTNTWFEPYVETTYDDYINDDRANFVLDKTNRLYLYCNIGGKPTDLDEMPTCVIRNDYDEVEQYNLEVKRQFKGVYYVELTMPHDAAEEGTMYYDVWSNLIYNGKSLNDVELDFTIQSSHNWFNIDNTMHDEPDYTPSVKGINNSEDIFRKDEVRKVSVSAIPNYTNNVTALVDEMYYRLYIMDGDREITVIPYQHINKSFNENFFYIDCNMLIPQRYFLDIRFKYNGETRTFKDVVHFNIVSNLDNKYF